MCSTCVKMYKKMRELSVCECGMIWNNKGHSGQRTSVLFDVVCAAEKHSMFESLFDHSLAKNLLLRICGSF